MTMYMSSSSKRAKTSSKKDDTIPQRRAYYLEYMRKLNVAFLSKYKKLTQDYKRSTSPTSSKEIEIQIKYDTEEFIRRSESVKRYFCGSDGDVYCFGMGEDGQLGFPDMLEDPDSDEEEEKVNDPDYDPYANVEEISVRIPRKLSIPGVAITHISAGSLHTVAITSRGQVYGWGISHGFVLGVDPGPGFVNAPRLLKSEDGLDYKNNHYIQVHAGSTFTLALSCQGNVYAAGHIRDSNSKQYKVARATHTEPLVGCNNKFTKMTCFGEGTVQQICGGESIAAALRYDGTLLTWGISEGEIGSLARPVPKDVRNDETGVVDINALTEHITPKEVQWADDKPQPISSVACGGNHMLMITRNCQVYSCGLNVDGQLGLGDEENRSKLTLIEAFKPYTMSHAAAGLYHSVCTDVSGRLFTFGRADGGRLGLPQLSDPNCPGMFCLSPAQIILPNGEKPKTIVCGDNNSMVTTDKGNLYFWGFDMDNDETIPKKVEFGSNVFVEDVSTGSQHTIVIATHVD